MSRIANITDQQTESSHRAIQIPWYLFAIDHSQLLNKVNYFFKWKKLKNYLLVIVEPFLSGVWNTQAHKFRPSKGKSSRTELNLISSSVWLFFFSIYLLLRSIFKKILLGNVRHFLSFSYSVTCVCLFARTILLGMFQMVINSVSLHLSTNKIPLYTERDVNLSK